MKNEKMLIICAWCGKVLVPADGAIIVSHGICKECKREVLKDATSKHKQDNSPS